MVKEWIIVGHMFEHVPRVWYYASLIELKKRKREREREKENEVMIKKLEDRKLPSFFLFRLIFMIITSSVNLFFSCVWTFHTFILYFNHARE